MSGGSAGRPRWITALAAAAITAAVLGVGMLVLQRWAAATMMAALLLVLAWFALVTVAAMVLARSRPALRAPMLATIALVLVGTGGIGYWTGFRKSEVDENVAMAATRVPERESAAALGAGGGEQVSDRPDGRKSAPVELAAGRISGADGHDARGTATVIAQPGGERLLTLTEFEADPGPDVNVYLSASADGIDDAIELGNLKGEIGDQQYEIPADADLNRYGTVVLYCIPFTTRIATAELG